MLTIICGEDTIASRNYFVSLKKDFLTKGFDIRDIKFEEIKEIPRWLAESPTLFFQKKVFFSENLNKKIKKDNKSMLAELQMVNQMSNADLIDWEGVSVRELKFSKLGKIKEFKPDQSIFKLLDELFPGNRSDFIKLLGRLTQDLDENFVFIMLTRYVRNLILVKEGVNPAKLQSWQVYKLKSQTKQWKIENLVNFYEALFRIEVGLKTSTNPFSIKKSLDILACHFL